MPRPIAKQLQARQRNAYRTEDETFSTEYFGRRAASREINDITQTLIPLRNFLPPEPHGDDDPPDHNSPGGNPLDNDPSDDEPFDADPPRGFWQSIFNFLSKLWEASKAHFGIFLNGLNPLFSILTKGWVILHLELSSP